MELSDSLPPKRTIEEVRREVEEEYKYVSDPLRRRSQIEYSTLVRVQSEQLTQELAVNYLKADETYYKELANQELAEGQGNLEFNYRIWSKVHDALLGATGKGDVSKTIDFFRESAAFDRKMVDENRKVIEQGGPFDGNPFHQIPLKEEQVVIWERSAKNLDTVARLFENQPQKFVETIQKF